MNKALLAQELDQTHAHYQKLLDDDEGSCSSVGGGESSGALLPVAVGGRHESTPAPPGTAASGLSGSKATSAAPASGGPLPTAGVVAGGLPAGGSAVNKGWLQRAVSRQSSASRSGRSRQTAAMAAELATATERAQCASAHALQARLRFRYRTFGFLVRTVWNGDSDAIALRCCGSGCAGCTGIDSVRHSHEEVGFM